MYGEHVSPVISVTHMRCDKDPTDIPKKSKDPTTSPVRQRKISKNTSHVMQGAIIFGDDITKSTVLTMVIKVIIPATARRYYKTLSPSCMIGLSNELRTATNLGYMSYVCRPRSENKNKE